MALVVSRKSSRLKSRGVEKVEVEQAAEASAGSNCSERVVVAGRNRSWADEHSVEALVVTLGVIVAGKFAEEVAEVPLAEEHKVVEAFSADGPDIPFGVRVAVRGAPQVQHALR